jgi:hypothetical protein
MPVPRINCRTLPAWIAILAMVITYFVFVMHSWSHRLNYGTDDVMLTVTPVSPRMHNKLLAHTLLVNALAISDSTTQRSDTRRKRKNKRLGRLQQVSPSASQDISPTNSQSSEVVHVRPARPPQHTVVRQHAAIPEDDEILEEMPSVQSHYSRNDQTRIHSSIDHRKQSLESNDHRNLSSIDHRKQSLESNDQRERRQSIRSQDMSDAPSTIYSVKQDQEDIHSRHVHFKSPQASARSRASTRRTSTDSNHSKENGFNTHSYSFRKALSIVSGTHRDQFPTLTQRERFFEEINERR